ncbi:MAG TPA: UrcA family protein [Steroidobacteraceae bacterium]|nr:UrcA family protein [Steroidobacteraceae bacterium]
MNTLISLTTAVVFGVAIQTVACAEEAPKSLTVQFADLDLSKDEGAATLFNRIKGAAERVCSTQRGGTTLRDTKQHAACVEFALLNAIARVDRPELTDYVAGRTSSKAKEPIKVASDR